MEPLSLSLREIITALSTGKLRARDLIEAGFANYQAHGDLLDAYKSRDPGSTTLAADAADAEFAAGRAHGPLQGIPISFKDLYGVTGYPTFAGSPERLPQAYERDGSLVSAVRRQFGICSGKTHTVEFAFGGLGTNPHWSTPRNPWDAIAHRVPGGSSAGAGVSLHLDAIIAFGTDTAGSVRIPASMTGCVGLKTSHGRWPVDGIVPLSSSLDTAGVLARSVEDAKIAFEALDDSAPVSPVALGDIKFGVCGSFFWEDCSPGVAECVQTSIDELASHGANIRAVELPETTPATELFMTGHMASPELYEFLSSCLPQWLETLNPQVALRMGEVSTLSAYEYLSRRRRLAELAELAAKSMADIDVLLTPTVVGTPPTLEETENIDQYRRANLLALRNTAMANLMRQCAITLPVGLDAAGMPVGLQLTASYGHDAHLLGIASAVEGVLGKAADRLGQAPIQ